MQYNTHGYFSNGKTVFEYEKEFWEQGCGELKEKQVCARKKYGKR